MPEKTFPRRFAVAATFAASLYIVGGAQPSYAQTPFTFNNGYDQTLNANGTVTGGTQYTFVTSTGNGPNGSNLSEVENPYNFSAGTTTVTTGGRGRNFSETSAANGTHNRVAVSFDVPAGMSIRLTGLTVYAYVNGVSTAINPFSAAHFAIYNVSPNTTQGNPGALAAATVAGDNTFTNNYLSSAAFSGTYRNQTAAGTNPADRPIFDINMDLTKSFGGNGTVSNVTLTSGRYYFAYSVDIDPAVNPNNFDAFAVIARPTLTGTETLNGKTYSGQPGRTDGSAQTYTSASGVWDTDQPVYSGIAGSPVVLDGFPFRLTGNIVGSEVPEPGALSLLFSAGVLGMPAAVRRVRRRSRRIV